MATIRDIFSGYPVEKSSVFTDFLNCFSLKRNGREILSTEINGKENLSCLYGIRFICMCCLILFHVSSSVLSGNGINTKHGYKVG